MDYSKRKVLTWDMLGKINFEGLTTCMLYIKEEENIEHIFNHCEFSLHERHKGWDQE